YPDTGPFAVEPDRLDLLALAHERTHSYFQIVVDRRCRIGEVGPAIPATREPWEIVVIARLAAATIAVAYPVDGNRQLGVGWPRWHPILSSQSVIYQQLRTS